MTGDRLLAEDLGTLATGASIRSTLATRALLRFQRAPDGKTFLAAQHAPYPFHICKPFYFEGDPPGLATVYAQSCAGGIFQDDRLHLGIEIGADAEAHLTTAASTIVHGMRAGEAQQRVSLTVQPGAYLEYMPDPLIMLPGARFTSQVELRIARSACALLCDAFLGHDPKGANGEFDRLQSETRLCDADGNLLALDRFKITGGDIRSDRPGAMGSATAHASMFLVFPPDAAAVIDAVRAALGRLEGVFAGVSALPHALGVFVRVLAVDGAAQRAALHAAWRAMRESIRGMAPAPRRK